MNNKGVFNKSAQHIFLNKTKTVLDVNKVLYSYKSTFDAITNETRFLATKGMFAEVQTLNPIFDDFQA